MRSAKVARLLRRGRDANIFIRSGARLWPLLNLAVVKGFTEIATLLLGHVAQVEATTDEGVNSLTTASEYGHLDLVALLISHGANVESANDKETTSLHSASLKGHVELVCHR